MKAPEFLFHTAVPSPATPSSYHVEMEEILVKISFLKMLRFCEVLLSFSDTSTVELFCLMVFKIHTYTEEFWERKMMLHFNSCLGRGQRSLVPHLWDLLFVKSLRDQWCSYLKI